MIQSKLAAFLLATATLGAGSVVLTPSTAHAQADVEVSFEFFNESLSPYGEWIEVGDYGLCWRPTAVDADWSPYTDGYWSYTDAGWTWVSYEDFGAITYHYGRWTNVEDEGWCWVPDYEWGPAWVSWRNNADYVGWAPLPPEARWEPSVGFSVWVDNSYDIGPSYYNFCAVEDFGAPVIREVILPRPRNVVIIQNTVNITNITVNRSIGIPFCGGPRYDFFVGRVRRPIPALKLVRETNVNNFYNNTVINKNVVKNTVINNKTVIKNGGGRGRALHAVQQGNQLIVPAPRVKRVANPLVAAPDIKPAKSVPASKVRKGWQLVQNAEQREQIKQKMARDAKGLRPETAPARAVETAELQPVPTKADPNAPSPLVTGGRGKRNGNGKNGNDRDRDTVAGVAAGEPAPQAPDADNDRPGKPGREKNRNERKENGAGIAAGEPSPMKPFNGDDGQDGPGRGKNRDRKKEKSEMAGADETPAADEGGRQEKVRKEREQVARAAELQEEFRKRQKEQAQAARQEKQQMNDNAGAAEEKAARRAERQREAAQAAAADIRREQQSRAAEREAAREQASKAERQAERQREAQAAAMARRQQQDGQERRQQMQSEAAQQRRQQAAAAAAEARREQMKSMQRQQMEAQQQQRGQAMRQQQMQMQRQLQRQQQQQFQAPQQQQQFRQGGGHGGGGGRGEGRGRRGEKGEKDN